VTVRLHTAASPSTGRSGIEETPGLVRIENLSLRAVISGAYGVKQFQIEGPAWLDAVSVDITAKPPAGYTNNKLQPLMRTLLIDRFKLAVHHESKDTAGFALTIAKGGPKLREATKPRGFFTARPGLIEGTRVSIAELAGVFARMLGRLVVDETALSAAYEVKVEWTPDQTSAAVTPDQQRDAPEPGQSLFTAVNDQLGLRLQTRKVPVDVVVVDRMEKTPTEN
jgi:uncharacterized protein (TIGR03435 family)